MGTDWRIYDGVVLAVVCPCIFWYRVEDRFFMAVGFGDGGVVWGDDAGEK